MNIIKLLKVMSGFSKSIIETIGMMFVIVLCVWSIVYLKGGSLEEVQLSSSSLVTSQELAWIWIAIAIVGIASYFVRIVSEIRNVIVKARDKNLSVGDKSRGFLQWFLKH